MHRRWFLKTLAAGSTAALAAGSLRAEADASAVGSSSADDDPAVLVDTTRCIGCRYCEVVCAEANGLPEPDFDDESPDRSLSEDQWSVINRFPKGGGEEEEEICIKRQCMHCVEPACAAACLTNAMYKTPEGPVIWREDKCMGCRYCMISCPFDIPKFEYDSAVPRLRKCIMCWERLKEGEQPACVAECPQEALLFGKRKELIKEGWRRILGKPEGYVDHIYGEHEAGGTSWLYLAAEPFDKLGLRTDLGTVAYPEYTKGFLYSVPLILILWPAILLGISNATKPDIEEADMEASDD